MNVIGEMEMPPLSKGGTLIVCPVCGQDEDLVLVMHEGDFTEEPSTMHCADMHEWVEPRVPRRLGAELFATKLRNNPEMVVHEDGTPFSAPPPRRIRRRAGRRPRR